MIELTPLKNPYFGAISSAVKTLIIKCWWMNLLKYIYTQVSQQKGVMKDIFCNFPHLIPHVNNNVVSFYFYAMNYLMGCTNMILKIMMILKEGWQIMTVNDNLEYSRQRKMHKVCLQANNSFSHLFIISLYGIRYNFFRKGR